MDTNKDIGAAVKNKLDNFKSSPDKLVWNNIEAQLKKKKKRRLVIFWLSGLGMTALFLLVWFFKPSPELNTIELPKTDAIISDFSTETSIDTSTQYKHTNQSKNKISDVITEQIKSDNESDNKQKSITRFSKTTAKSPIITSSENHDSISKTLLKDSILNSNSISLKKVSPHTSPTTHDLEYNSELLNANIFAKKDSLKIKESLPEEVLEEQTILTELISEDHEKEKDSSVQINASRWSVTPQLVLSTYNAFNAKTTDKVSVNYGMLASYRLTEKTHFRIGVRKLNLKQTVDTIQRSIEYLEFPIELKYAPFQKKINPYFTGGISYFTVIDSQTTEMNSLDYQPTFSINLGLGIETKLFNNINVNLEPNFNYQPKPFSNGNNLQPFIFSISLGIEYRF
ncbi:outer membrane beta-barrel protein [Psychroserpens sp. MEBiC05023]